MHRHNTIWVINASCRPNARVSGAGHMEFLREEMLGLLILPSKTQAGTARAVQLFIHPRTKIITHTNMCMLRISSCYEFTSGEVKNSYLAAS